MDQLTTVGEGVKNNLIPFKFQAIYNKYYDWLVNLLSEQEIPINEVTETQLIEFFTLLSERYAPTSL